MITKSVIQDQEIKGSMSESEIRQTLRNLRYPATEVFLSITMSQSGAFIAEQSDDLYYLQRLLKGLHSGQEELVKDYFIETSIAKSLGLINRVALNAMNNPDSNLLLDKEEIDVLYNLVYCLVSWSDLIKQQAFLNTNYIKTQN